MSLVWFVTGTSSGFGRQLVLSLLARGDRVIATARRLESIQDFPRSDNIRVLALDVSWKEEQIKTVVDQAITLWGHIDVVVNNAGVVFMSLAEEGGTQVFRDQYEVTFFGALAVTNAVLPHMRSRKSGTIVQMGSRSSWRSEVLGGGPYISSKAAIRVYSETLAMELAPFSIRMLIVESAAYKTESLHSNQETVYRNPIPDYDDIREKVTEWRHTFFKWEAEHGGDPRKAMEVLVDVVKGEGKAKGRPWPLYLLLGEQTLPAVKAKSSRIIQTAEEWDDVTRDAE